MDHSIEAQTAQTSVLGVATGADQLGEQCGLDVSEIAFRVTPQRNGGLFIIKNMFHEKDDPARYLHYDQEEWF